MNLYQVLAFRSDNAEAGSMPLTRDYMYRTPPLPPR